MKRAYPRKKYAAGGTTGDPKPDPKKRPKGAPPKKAVVFVEAPEQELLTYSVDSPFSILPEPLKPVKKKYDQLKKEQEKAEEQKYNMRDTQGRPISVNPNHFYDLLGREDLRPTNRKIFDRQGKPVTTVNFDPVAQAKRSQEKGIEAIKPLIEQQAAVEKEFDANPANTRYTQLSDPFIKEAQNLRAFYKRTSPGTQVEINPVYRKFKGEIFSEEDPTAVAIRNRLKTVTPEDDVFLFGHHGSRYAGIPNESWAKMLGDIPYGNCFLGSCGSEDLVDPKEGAFRNLQNFYYRPDSPWLGVNPKGNTIQEAMFSRDVETDPNAPDYGGDEENIGARIVKPVLGKQYKINRPRLAFGGSIPHIPCTDCMEKQMAMSGKVKPRRASKMAEKYNFLSQYAPGGQVGAEAIGGLANAAPQLLNAIMSIAEGPMEYSEQPIVNASTMKNMASPYDQFATGGTKKKKHWIQKAVNPAHKGYCTPMTKSTCTPRRKALAKTFKKHHGFHKKGYGGDMYAYGGEPIEVEGGEVMEYPNGAMAEVSGPSHEQGGVDVNVPDGTKIYSDRLKIEGETMKERKKKREKHLAKLDKLMQASPQDRLVKNTYDRSKFHIEMEEAQDMQLQNAMNDIYNNTGGVGMEALQGMGTPQEELAAYGGQYAYGGQKWYGCGGQYGCGGMKKRYRVGGSTDPDDPLFGGFFDAMNYMGRYQDVLNQDAIVPTDRIAPNLNQTIHTQRLPINPYSAIAKPKTTPAPYINQTPPPYQMTVGDYVGMAGNAFNAIAPIMNTKAAARATKPVMNRFKGFGQRALDTNQSALDAYQTAKEEAARDISTAVGSARLNNRSGARGINTLRALDVATTAGANKANAAARTGFVQNVANLLGQRSQLFNLQDQAEMEGQSKADEANAMNLDNYYSTMANNLVNFGTNVQGIGKSLNKSKYNDAQIRLLRKLSPYGYDPLGS